MIDLLTVEEAKKIPEDIRMCKTPKGFDSYSYIDNACWWWLRTPGYDSFDAAVVGASGAVDGGGDYVDYDSYAVRPVIRVTDESLNDMKETDDGYIRYLGTKWINITEYTGAVCLLKKKCLKKPHRFDAESNNYEKSEIKDFIEKWYEKKLKKNIGEKRSHDKGGENEEK